MYNKYHQALLFVSIINFLSSFSMPAVVSFVHLLVVEYKAQLFG